jgi:hypothetical protein
MDKDICTAGILTLTGFLRIYPRGKDFIRLCINIPEVMDVSVLTATLCG